MLTEKQKQALDLGRQKGLKRIRPRGLVYNFKKENTGRFKKGSKPWCTGTKGLVKAWNKGTKGLMKPNSGCFKPGETADENNPKWKGDEVGYFGLHTWVQRKLGKANVCEICSATKNVEWSNKSWEYKRELEDWQQLCKKHHMEYDRDNQGATRRKYNL